MNWWSCDCSAKDISFEPGLVDSQAGYHLEKQFPPESSSQEYDYFELPAASSHTSFFHCVYKRVELQKHMLGLE
ncbi:hypothetical protein E2C01_047870 [Portunus trituberculatus]|uniref:Uncharacterized protein n=1 Tax=Portunus trituberculatus TaxID=210409 RepID=A0A5B7G913_PORTR|nr:hypothetical protein [Portunus trituberculatus]